MATSTYLPTRFLHLMSLSSKLLILLLISSSSLGSHANIDSKSKSTLLIVDKTNNIANFKQTHSNLIKLLEEIGDDVSIKSAEDSTLKLSKYGEYLYDNLLIFCPNVESFRGSFGRKDILEFIDSGRNALIVGNQSPSSLIADLANEVGFEFRETSVKRDYANTKLNDIFYLVGDISKYPSTSFTFSGTQLKMLKSNLNLEILSNNAPVDDIRPSTPGKFVTNVLIGAMQALNNARVIVSGSAEFFSDTSFQTSKMANKHLTSELLKWLLKEKSLLRYSHVSHRYLNSKPSTSTDIASKTNFEGYTIMDDIEYSIKIEIYNDGKWNPYTGEDVQLEFIRIDPFVRQTLVPQNDGMYVARFKVPDVYGVYKFQVDYKKEGLTYLFSSTQVSVRPLRHNEYERYIYSAYPYYLSAFLMIAYLYIFSFVYLYQQKEKRNNK